MCSSLPGKGLLSGAAGRRMLYLLALLQLLSVLLPGAHPAPLEGQGNSPSNHTIVYVNAYLERLFHIDDKAFNFQAEVYLFLHWADHRAKEDVQTRSMEIRDGIGGECKRYCDGPMNGRSAWQACCDTMWLPDMGITNLVDLSFGEIQGSHIAIVGDKVQMFATLKGTFFTHMKFQDYPFDEHLLDIRVILDNQGHADARVVLEMSSSGMLGTFQSRNTSTPRTSQGLDVDGWDVEAVHLQSIVRHDENFIRETSQGFHPNDTVPFILPPSSVASVFRYNETTGEDEVVFVQTAHNVSQGFVIMIEVHRIANKHIFNVIIPQVLCVWLAGMAFVINNKLLEERIGVIVTLFLALAAVQFVITDIQPASARTISTQQVMVLSYIYLGLAGIESIIAYLLATAYERNQQFKQFVKAEIFAIDALAEKGFTGVTNSVSMLAPMKKSVASDPRVLRRVKSIHKSDHDDCETTPVKGPLSFSSQGSPDIGQGQPPMQASGQGSDMERPPPETTSSDAVQLSVDNDAPASLHSHQASKQGPDQSDAHCCFGAFKSCAPSTRQTTRLGKWFAALYYLPRNSRRIESYGEYAAWNLDQGTFWIWLVSYHIILILIFVSNDLLG